MKIKLLTIYLLLFTSQECCEVADAFREGKLGKIYWNFPKQTKSEFEDDNFFVEVK